MVAAHRYINHFPISLNVTFLPYNKIPTRYIRPANHTKKNAAPIVNTNDRMICHIGGLKAIRNGMAIGENKGKREANTISPLSGGSCQSGAGV